MIYLLPYLKDIISNSREYFVREKSASYAFYVVSLKTRNLLKFEV